MRDSILYAALRSFMVALFSITGIGLGFVALIIVFSLLLSTSENEPEANFSVEILPNAEGVRKSMSSDTPVILQVNINGIIGIESLSQQTIRQLLVESREDTLKKDRVKAILLNIMSPGGTVMDADGIYEALKAYKKQYKVPIYAYVDGLCASGGMYVACAADKIYASDVSIIGSVGVTTPSFLNFSQLIDKIGIQALTLIAGKGKDELNPLRPWKPGEQENMQNIINDYYQKFVNIVVTNRPLVDENKLVSDYGAHIFLADKALEYGFIDSSNYSREQTLKELLKDLNIEDDQYQVVQLSGKSWLSSFLAGETASSLITGSIKHEIKWPQELNPALSGKYLYLYRG